jgi:hypothetical protein
MGSTEPLHLHWTYSPECVEEEFCEVHPVFDTLVPRIRTLGDALLRAQG